jgi:acyl-CoA thioester hydrolase
VSERKALADYRFATEVSVRFAETDLQGVAHHSAYLVWFEIARIDYLARFDGGYPALRAQGVDATTLEAYARYLAPARFGDQLRIAARCADVRGARFAFEYAVERDGERVAEGWTNHACVDVRTLRPTRMPGWLADAIAKAEA